MPLLGRPVPHLAHSEAAVLAEAIKAQMLMVAPVVLGTWFLNGKVCL